MQTNFLLRQKVKRAFFIYLLLHNKTQVMLAYLQSKVIPKHLNSYLLCGFIMGGLTIIRSMFTSSFSCSTVLRASAILAMLLDILRFSQLRSASLQQDNKC